MKVLRNALILPTRNDHFDDNNDIEQRNSNHSSFESDAHKDDEGE